MTITIEIGGELQAELARRAAAHGIGIDAYAASLLEEVAHLPPAPGKSISSPPAEVLVEAIYLLRSFGRTHGLSLDGMTIRELRHEARP